MSRSQSHKVQKHSLLTAIEWQPGRREFTLPAVQFTLSDIMKHYALISWSSHTKFQIQAFVAPEKLRVINLVVH